VTREREAVNQTARSALTRHPQIVTEQSLHAWQRRTEWPLTGLAVAFLGAYALPILDPDMPRAGRTACTVITVAAWGAFGVDYLVRLLLASRRWRFVRGHLADLAVLVLPLLRPLRALRLVPVLSALNQASSSFRGQVTTYVIGSVALIVFVASLAVLDAERRNPDANINAFPDAVWWSLTTITTVGYGDRYPTTGQGRLVAVGLMLAGIALLGVVTATLASWFVERIRLVERAEEQTHDEVRELLDEVRALRARLDGTPSQGREPTRRGGTPM
jgi:voltage-gated potassium channel